MFEILMIDKNEYFEFICTAINGLTDENYFDQVSTPFNKLLQSFGSLHVHFKKGKLMKIHPSTKELDIEVIEPTSSSALIERLSYDFLVIATGSSYNFPIKEPYESMLI